MENYHWALIILIILLSGSLGGTVNYFFNYTPIDGDNNRKWDRLEFIKSLIVGIAASFLMPLFLNMISSNLLIESRNDVYKLFIFSGFCLIAAISSKSFILSISQKILKDLEQVDKKVEKVKKEVNTLIDKETEYDPNNESDDTPNVVPGAEEDEEETRRIKILKALGLGKYVFRSLQGISNEINLSINEINVALNDLISDNFVNQSVRDKGIYFYITKEGREHLNWYTGKRVMHHY